jgi:hypothetical protein
MANFHKFPGTERISGQTLTVQGDTLMVGIWGYKVENGQELVVSNDGEDLAIFPAGTSGNSSLWKITVTQTARSYKTSIKDKIYALTTGFKNYDSFEVNFNLKPVAAGLDVRCITAELFGGPANEIWRGTATPNIDLLTGPRLLPNQPPPKLEFNRQYPGQKAAFAVFAARHGGVERAFILVIKRGSRPKNLLVVIPHPFAQGRGIGYYGGKGFFQNPLSLDMVRDVTDRFALARWGSQLLAARDDSYALLIPVPSGVGHGGEIGPFANGPGIGSQIIGRITDLTGGTVAANAVGICCFSGGVHNANAFIAAGGKGLNFRFACNQDPVSGTPISAAVAARRQYISGYTTGGPRAGFIYLPESSWTAEPKYAVNKASLGGEYPHTWAVPNYTLYHCLAAV